MIKMQEEVPVVYYNMSRDFQVIGRLYDLVLNSVKTNADLIKSMSTLDNISNKFLDLIAYTIGFKSKHNYNVDQLNALSKVFSTILKNKGNLTSIYLAGYTLLNAEGIDDEFVCYVNENVVEMYISDKLSDINLLNDLLVYILPAGTSSKIVRATQIEIANVLLELGYHDRVSIYKINNYNVSVIIKAEEGQQILADIKSFDAAGTTTHQGMPESDRESWISTIDAGFDAEVALLHGLEVDTIDNTPKNYSGYFMNGGLINPEVDKEINIEVEDNLRLSQNIRQPHQKKIELLSAVGTNDVVRQPHQRKISLESSIGETDKIRQPHQITIRLQSHLSQFNEWNDVKANPLNTIANGELVNDNSSTNTTGSMINTLVVQDETSD